MFIRVLKDKDDQNPETTAQLGNNEQMRPWVRNVVSFSRRQDIV